MIEVQVEVLLPSAAAGDSEVDIDDVDLRVTDLDVTTHGIVQVREGRAGPVALVRGRTSDPSALASDPAVVGVWVGDAPLWAEPVGEDEPSRYAF